MRAKHINLLYLFVAVLALFYVLGNLSFKEGHVFNFFLDSVYLKESIKL